MDLVDRWWLQMQNSSRWKKSATNWRRRGTSSRPNWTLRSTSTLCTTSNKTNTNFKKRFNSITNQSNNYINWTGGSGRLTSLILIDGLVNGEGESVIGRRTQIKRSRRQEQEERQDRQREQGSHRRTRERGSLLINSLTNFFFYPTIWLN